MTRTDDASARPLLQVLSQWIAITPQEIAPLKAYVRALQVPRQRMLFRVGDAVDDLLLLQSGLARSYQHRNGREVNLRFLAAPAAALPYNSFLQQMPADECLQAMTDLRGWRVRFRDFCREQAGLLAERLQRLLAERHFLSMQRRVHMLQAGNAACRYAYFRSHMEPEIVAGTPAYHVASYLGITPESLSRLRRAERDSDGPARRDDY